MAVALDQPCRDPYGSVIYMLTLPGYVMFTFPLIVIFFLAQRYIVQGVVTSGLKGV